MVALKTAERTKAIEEMVDASLNVKAVETRRADWQKHAQPVRWLSNLLVVFIFGITPALIWFLGLALTWLWLLLSLLALTVTTATMFARAHRALYPDAHDERFTHTLTIALAPTSAMRAHDALSRPLLETFHPLAVAKSLLSDFAFKAFARRILIDVRHPQLPLCSNTQPAAEVTEKAFRQMALAAIEQLLAQHGIKPTELCRPPARSEESSRAYCPRCESQFTTEEGQCADCGGIPLIAFKKTSD
jgi:hypothetical protein